MSDIKSVLSLLCQYLNLSINVPIKPEYFRLAKFNDTAENVTETLWALLDSLSCHAIREKEVDVDFQEYDTLTAVKLRFAYLQYPVIEFYGLSESSSCNRQLLIAFAWLLGTQNVLSTVLRLNLGNSTIGKEFSYSNAAEAVEVQNSPPNSLIGQINNIIHLNGRVNYNIKEISELLSERAKLISKVHAASINVSGLPHLSVSELALAKRLATTNKNTYSNEIQSQLKELSTIGNLIDTHMKWTKREPVFFDWMVTVIQEHDKSLKDNRSSICWREVSKFISSLHHVIKRKLESLTSRSEANSCREFKAECISRLLRTQTPNTEVEEWLMNTKLQLTQETEELRKRKEELSNELKEMLKLIPSCIQI